MAGSRTLKLSILGDVNNLNKNLKGASADVDTFGDKIGKAGKKIGAAFAVAAVAAGAMAVKIGIDAVKSASDLSETISKVGVLFGDTAKDIENFATTAASSLGQTKQQALDAAATFATFGKAAGLTGQDLSKFSIDFVKLSSDLASFNNTSPEQAINAIGSALRGEAEPLRAYGVLLDDASLRQAALSLGIINTTKNALTPQQKVLAAQKLIFEQTGTAQGDFERTSSGLANTTRILSAQLENAKTTIGTALLPVVLEIATFIGTNFLPIVERLSDAFASKDSGLNKSLSDVGNAVRQTVMPIFEGAKKVFDSVKTAIMNSKEEFAAFFEVVQFVAPIIGKTIGAALQVIGAIAKVVITVIAQVLAAIKPLMNTAIDGINLVIKGINLIKPGADIGSIGKIGATSGGGGGFSGTTPGGQSFSGGITVPKIAVPKLAVPIVRTQATASSAPVINLNVSGAIDKEGTARTIVETLNNSFYRGGGGGGNSLVL